MDRRSVCIFLRHRAEPLPTLTMPWYVHRRSLGGKLAQLSCLVLVCVLGCGDGKIARYPVSGSVKVNGKPAAGARVIFCPVGGSEEFQKERPTGKTDDAGNFDLTTFVKGDGAPAGDYQLSIMWIPSKGQAPDKLPEGMFEERTGGGRGDLLRGRFANPAKSGLTATVTETENSLPPFELEVPKRNRP